MPNEKQGVPCGNCGDMIDRDDAMNPRKIFTCSNCRERLCDICSMKLQGVRCIICGDEGTLDIDDQ